LSVFFIIGQTCYVNRSFQVFTSAVVQVVVLFWVSRLCSD